MKNLILILIVIFSCSKNENQLKKVNKPIENKVIIKRKSDLSDPSNKLSGKIQTLELRYIVWGCACANWVEVDKFEKNGNLGEKTIFIEPSEKKLELPKNFDAFKQKIIIKGEFYINPDYPKGTLETEEELKKAPVFRYTEIKVERL